MKRYALIGGVACVVIVSGIIWLDVYRTAFETRSDAEREGAFEKGMLPPIIPSDASGIEHAFSSESGTMQFTFSFSSTQWLSALSAGVDAAVAPRFLSEWPDALSGEVNWRAPPPGFSLYCYDWPPTDRRVGWSGQTVSFAVDATNHRAYCWWSSVGRCR